MLAPAVYFVQVILALHILAVVAAFGVLFAYPIFLTIGANLDPGAIAGLKSCSQTACHIRGGEIDGWIPRDRIWGVDADEVFK